MLEIKKMEFNDLDFFCEVRNSCAEKFLHNPNKFSYEDTKNWFITNKPDYYIIFLNQEKIGYFRTSNYNQKDNSLYIGCDLLETYRGQGLGFLAYKKFIPQIFNDYNLEKLTLEVLSQNVNAKKLYAKLGFKNIPEKKYTFDRNGEINVSEFWELNKNEYHGE